MLSTYSFLREQAQNNPSGIAVTDNSTDITYSMLLASATQLAEVLTEENADSRIAFQLPNGAAFISTLFGILKFGAVAIPISTTLTPEEVQIVLEKSGCSHLIQQGTSADVRNSEVLISDNLILSIQQQKIDLRPKRLCENAAVIRFTSGTTGTPKGVVLDHSAIFERTEAAQQVLQLSKDDRVTWVMPMAYHFIVSILAFVRYGVRIVISPTLSSTDILKCMNLSGTTKLYCSPETVHALAFDYSRLSLPDGCITFSTTTRLSQKDSDSFYARFQKRPRQLYGIIEVGLPLISTEEVLSTSTFVPAPPYEASVIDSDGNEVGIGASGYLATSGPGMFKHYIDAEEQIYPEEWFLTGDIATRGKNKTIEILGRSSTAVQVPIGYIFPEQIEESLATHTAIRSTHVTIERNPSSVLSLLCDIVLSSDFTQEQVRQFEMEWRELALFPLHGLEVKVNFKTVNKIVMTDSGKIVRGRGSR